MSIRDIRRLEQQGYSDYTEKDDNFYKNIDPSFEAYKNYGDILDERSSLDNAIIAAGGEYEAPDTTATDTSTLAVLGTLATNYGKWEPYASSLLRKGFPNATFSSTQAGQAAGTFGKSGASTTLGAAASKYYGNLTSGTAAGIGPGVGTALVGYGIKEIFGDDDPTTYTAPEQLGSAIQGAGTGATIASLLNFAGPLGIAAGAFLGWRAGKKKQKKAIKEATEQRQRDIAELYEENRLNLAARAEEDDYLRMRSQFDNPYGIEMPQYTHGGYHIGVGGMGPGPSGGTNNTSPSTTSTTSGTTSGGFQGQGNFGGPVGVGGNVIQTAPTPFVPNPSYAGFLAGLPMQPAPVINQGQFVGGATQRTSLLEGRSDAGDAGGFLQRLPSEEPNFYRTGEKGMKVAEVTGNEVIMPAERQKTIEKAIAKGDNETPGKVMKQTLAEGKVTKGAASHDSNPMPIMSTGAVLDKQGKDTGLKADDGAGIYHQASKQFKPGMSNSEMTKIIKKNIKSWKKQGKA